MHCQGMYIYKELWRHVRRCPCKPENEDFDKEPGRTKVLRLAVADKSVLCQQISSGAWKLVSDMKQDDVASVVRNDLSIIQLHSHCTTNTNKYMRQKLREVEHFFKGIGRCVVIWANSYWHTTVQ